MFACLYSPSPDTHDGIERVARDFSPRVERRRDAVVVIDLSGLERLIGPPHAIAGELGNAAPGVHVAIAATSVAAYLLACARAGVTVAEAGTERGALAPLRLDLLRELNAPADLLETLERWGIRTLGDFAALPPPALSARLGQDGIRWQRVARGDDARPLVPSHPEERFEAMLDLEWPVDAIEPLAFVLTRLLDGLCAQLERRDRAVAALTVRLRDAVSRQWQSRRLELPSAMRDPRTLRTLICLDLEGHPPEAGIDRVAVFVEPTPGRIGQGSLLARPAIAPEEAATLMARLRALMGHDRCGTPQLVDTHRPGAFAMGDWRGEDTASRSTFPYAGPTVPLRGTLRRTAESSLRRLRHPVPARVVTEDGRPVRVITDRRGWEGGRVLQASGPWRSSGDWWTPDPWNHQEWDVTLSDGGRYRIHQSRAGGAGRNQKACWFIEAVLD
jgi:protein ImuB